MTPEDKLRYLLTMAAADESIAREELRMLGKRALAWGISDDQFEALIEEAINGQTPLALPESREERTAVLADLIRMMGADGRMDEREKRLFAVVAAQSDISVTRLNEIIDTAITDSDHDDVSG